MITGLISLIPIAEFDSAARFAVAQTIANSIKAKQSAPLPNATSKWLIQLAQKSIIRAPIVNKKSP